MNCKAGVHVYIEGGRGAVVGEVLVSATPAELADISEPGGPPLGDLQRSLREREVDQVLLLRHPHNADLPAFWALHYPEGWRDLRGEDLAIHRLGKG